MTTHIKYAIDEGLGLTADALNTRARRKALDAEVRNPMGPYDELVPFDGKLERPMLTMHGTGDLFVPIVLEQTLKRAVVAAGKQSLLAQRVYRIAGHCGFSQPEMIKAFDDLIAWVHKSVKPEGDEVYGDLSSAGMKFTEPLRPNDSGDAFASYRRRHHWRPGRPLRRWTSAATCSRFCRQQCYGCHGPTQQMNGFRLDRRRDAMRGGHDEPGDHSPRQQRSEPDVLPHRGQPRRTADAADGRASSRTDWDHQSLARPGRRVARPVRERNAARPARAARGEADGGGAMGEAAQPSRRCSIKAPIPTRATTSARRR